MSFLEDVALGFTFLVFLGVCFLVTVFGLFVIHTYLFPLLLKVV